MLDEGHTNNARASHLHTAFHVFWAKSTITEHPEGARGSERW